MIATTLAGVGATIIVTQSFLFKPLRNAFKKEKYPYISKLFTCPQCLGFWTGLLFKYLELIYLNIDLKLIHLIPIFFEGCIVSLIALFVYLVMLKLGLDKI